MIQSQWSWCASAHSEGCFLASNLCNVINAKITTTTETSSRTLSGCKSSKIWLSESWKVKYPQECFSALTFYHVNTIKTDETFQRWFYTGWNYKEMNMYVTQWSRKMNMYVTQWSRKRVGLWCRQPFIRSFTQSVFFRLILLTYHQ